MSEEMIENSQIKHSKRPKGVWAISIFYFLSSIYTLLSFYLIHTGTIAVPEATQKYLEGLTVSDYALSILIGLITLAGAVSLFLLRKVAYSLFLCSFVINILMSAWYALSKNMLSALVRGGAIGMVIGWGILLAAWMYARKLSKAGILH